MENLDKRFKKTVTKKNNPLYISKYPGKLAKKENNDCVVRAMAASFDVPYEDAHKQCSITFGRKNGEGTFAVSMTLESLGDTPLMSHQVIPFGVKDKYSMTLQPKKTNGQNMTIASLDQLDQNKSYLIVVDKHAFAYIDGVIVGNQDDGDRRRTRIHNVFEIVPPTNP